MSEKAEKRGLKFFFKMSNLHMKSEQIAFQLFHSYFDLHGESAGVKYQNDYYIMQALCAFILVKFKVARNEKPKNYMGFHKYT